VEDIPKPAKLPTGFDHHLPEQQQFFRLRVSSRLKAIEIDTARHLRGLPLNLMCSCVHFFSGKRNSFLPITSNIFSDTNDFAGRLNEIVVLG